MRRALVLGGGGPVGIGWQSGLLTGLAEAAVDLSQADLVSGTSAGSVVGAALRSGLDLHTSLELVESPPPGLEVGGIDRMFAELTRAATGAAPASELLVNLGRVAMEAPTIAEDDYLAQFSILSGQVWPDRFQCTAVDVESGEFRIWDSAAGAPLERAVASSCAVPGVFPPVTVDGRRYMDGGMRTALNADVAAGCDVAVIVSCFALELPPGFSDPVADMLSATQRSELDTLGAAGTDGVTVAPNAEFLELSGWGLNLFDFSLARPAFDVGRRQAAEERDRVAAAWG